MIGINHIYQCAHHPHVLLLTFMSTYNYLPKEKESDISSAVSDSVRHQRRQPTRLPSPWDSPGKNTGVGCHFLLQCMKVKVKSLTCVQLCATSETAAHQAPQSRRFSRQELEWAAISFSNA